MDFFGTDPGSASKAGGIAGPIVSKARKLVPKVRPVNGLKPTTTTSLLPPSKVKPKVSAAAADSRQSYHSSNGQNGLKHGDRSSTEFISPRQSWVHGASKHTRPSSSSASPAPPLRRKASSTPPSSSSSSEDAFEPRKRSRLNSSALPVELDRMMGPKRQWCYGECDERGEWGMRMGRIRAL